MMAIGEEACCRTVDAKVVQFLIHSMLGSGVQLQPLRMVENGSVYVNGRLVFSCTFLRGDGK